MTVRGLFRGLIVNHAPLTNLVPTDEWVSSGAMNEENAPPRPFAVIRYGPTNIGLADIKRAEVTLWVHDELGDYTRINKVLDLLYARLNGQEHVADSESEIIMIEWLSTSGDLFDPGYRTLTRNITFNLVGKGV